MNTADRLATALQGRYTILRELGSGGMATVYVAHDVRHDREVAVKVLHPDLGAVLGGERFLSEIKTTARLQHPHILPLLDSGDADGLLFYVMPLVEGQTLRVRLERERQLPIDEALRIASEVAGALDYAHRHGVIHRDIKPENILLHDGRAVVADFGIALAVSAASGTRMTQTGLSLGTPQYMAPEQAMGEKIIDARADVYALGAVTYEMLTGEPPFSGATVQAIVAKVLTEKPMSPSAVRDTVPRHVEATIIKALAKLPADRFATAAQFAASLAQPELTAHTTQSATMTGGSAGTRGWRRHISAAPAVWIGFAAVALLAAWSLIARPGDESTEPAPVMKIYFSPEERVRFFPVPSLAIAGDGSRIAFVGFDSTNRRQIYVRSLDRVEPAAVAGTENATTPFFSPDGKILGFQQGGKLKTVSLQGGSVNTVCDWGISGGATWGDTEIIVFSTSGMLYQVPATGGTATAITSARGDEGYYRPSFLPGSRAVIAETTGDSAGIVAFRLGDPEIRRLIPGGSYPQYVRGGLLVYGLIEGVLLAAPFDEDALEVTGPSEVITEGVVTAGPTISRFAVALDGTLVYLVGSTMGRQLVLLNRTGATVHTLPENLLYRFPRFSPDGKRLAFHVEIRGGMQGDIWSYDIDRGTLLRLTSDSVSGQPEWDPDNKSLVFITRGGLRRVASDGSARPVEVLKRPNLVFESRVTPDRRTIVFREDVTGNNRDILMASLDSPAMVRPLLTTSFDEKGFALSPDGRWLAYVSNETGVDQVFLRRLQENSARWPVSRGGGREARWAKNEIFYRWNDSTYAVRVDLGTEPTIGPPKALFAGRFANTGFEPLWDVSPDGLRFAFVATPNVSGRQLGLMINWADHWKARQRK